MSQPARVEAVPPELLRDFAFLGLNLHAREWPLEMVGRYAGKKLVICAGARCVWDDLALLGVRNEHNELHVMAVNDISMHLPMRVRHLYSNDRKMIPRWLSARREQITRKFGPIEHTHTLRLKSGVKWAWPWPGHGTSALGATYTGLCMGYSQVILCGCPLDNSPNYFSPPWEGRNFTAEVGTRTDGEMMYWAQAARKCFRGRVKSMSGRTRELLGAP